MSSRDVTFIVVCVLALAFALGYWVGGLNVERLTPVVVSDSYGYEVHEIKYGDWTCLIYERGGMWCE